MSPERGWGAEPEGVLGWVAVGTPLRAPRVPLGVTGSLSEGPRGLLSLPRLLPAKCSAPLSGLEKRFPFPRGESRRELPATRGPARSFPPPAPSGAERDANRGLTKPVSS